MIYSPCSYVSETAGRRGAEFSTAVHLMRYDAVPAFPILDWKKSTKSKKLLLYDRSCVVRLTYCNPYGSSHEPNCTMRQLKTYIGARHGTPDWQE